MKALMVVLALSNINTDINFYVQPIYPISKPYKQRVSVQSASKVDRNNMYLQPVNNLYEQNIPLDYNQPIPEKIKEIVKEEPIKSEEIAEPQQEVQYYYPQQQSDRPVYLLDFLFRRRR